MVFQFAKVLGTNIAYFLFNVPNRGTRIPPFQMVWAEMSGVKPKDILKSNSQTVARSVRDYVFKFDDIIDEGKMQPAKAPFHPELFSARHVYRSLEGARTQAPLRELHGIFQVGRQRMLNAISQKQPSTFKETYNYRLKTTGEYCTLVAKLMNKIHGVQNGGDIERRFRHFGLAAQFFDDIMDVRLDKENGLPNLFTSLLREEPFEEESLRARKGVQKIFALKRYAPKTFRRYVSEYEKEMGIASHGSIAIRSLLWGAKQALFRFGVQTRSRKPELDGEKRQGEEAMERVRP
ncbi:MAG: class 1 isoprenoid biosynthesis enzyme [Candidatus Micrarchaeota archaeon]